MAPAIWDTQSVTFVNESGTKFKASGKVLKFEGWRKVYNAEAEEKEEGILPSLSEGEILQAKLKLLEEKTKPPSRYTEGSIVKWMEKTGVGRPSTYASTVKTLKKRGYVILKAKSCFLLQ